MKNLPLHLAAVLVINIHIVHTKAVHIDLKEKWIAIAISSINENGIYFSY